jgi:ribosomal protein S18 acetylase RimI-like enzyme
VSDTQQVERALLIRRAVAADATALARLAEDTFRTTFAADNTPDDMALHCATEYGPEIQGGQIADSSIDTLVATDEDGSLIAYAQIRPGAPATVTTPAPIELWRFYVDPLQHGRGLAQRMMDAVVDAARARGARTLWLGVWERNVRAQKFYRKCGFIEIGTQTFVLGRDPQTDLVMLRPL